MNCSAGKWREHVNSGTVGAIRRVTSPLDGSPGREVWELVDDYVEGEIVDIQHTTHPEFPDRWEVTIRDGEEVLVLQMKYDSGYAIAFLTKLRNLDLTRKVMFIPYFFEAEKKSRMVLKQEGMKIPSYYGREDPKGFPEYREDFTKAEATRWKLDVLDFLEKELEEHIRPSLPGLDEGVEEMDRYQDRSGDGSTARAESDAAPAGEVHDPGPGEDDLPF